MVAITLVEVVRLVLWAAVVLGLIGLWVVQWLAERRKAQEGTRAESEGEDA